MTTSATQKFVKVAKLGDRVQEFFVDNGATVADALRLAGYNAAGFDLRVNGSPVCPDQPLNDSDILTLVPAIKGGQYMVKVAKLGERVQEYYLEDGSSVGNALDMAGYSTTGFDLRVNGSPATVYDDLDDGDIITLVPAIKGGC
jgi:sulfur carrier protein ThiS